MFIYTEHTNPMGKTVLAFTAFILALFFLPKQVFADFNFSTEKQSISDTEDLTVNVNLDLSSSTANKNYYLRTAFYKSGSTQYFGFTQNNDNDYYNGPYSDNNCTKLYKITTDSDGNWQGTITAKVDAEDAAFEGTGDYLFKIGRYTEACSLTWADNDPVQIVITQTIFPSPSPTPATSPSPAPTSKSSPTPKASAKTSPKTSPTSLPIVKSAGADPQVLGQSSQSSDSGRVVSTTQLFSSPPQSDQGYPQPVSQKVAAILISAGAILIGISFVSFMWYKRNQGRANINKEKDRFEENKQEE